MEGGFLSPVLLDALYHLIAPLPQPDHLHQLFRGVLEVAVQHGAGVSPGLLQAGEHGGLLAEVPAEPHPHHPGVQDPGGLDGGPGAVGGAVVHEDELIVDIRPGQDPGHPLGSQGDGLLLVPCGNDDR